MCKASKVCVLRYCKKLELILVVIYMASIIWSFSALHGLRMLRWNEKGYTVRQPPFRLRPWSYTFPWWHSLIRDRGRPQLSFQPLAKQLNPLTCASRPSLLHKVVHTHTASYPLYYYPQLWCFLYHLGLSQNIVFFLRPPFTYSLLPP